VADQIPDSTKCSASPDHADILETIQNAADDWQKQGYPTALAEVRDMANVGRALMTAIADNAGSPPADCPSEIVSDLLNMRDATTRAAPPAMDREAVDDIIGRIRTQADCLEGYAESHGFSGKAPASVFHWQATHFRDLAAEMERALSTLSADAIRQGLDHKVAAFVADYEFRGDDGDFTPDSMTKVIIEDAIHGFLAIATPASHVSDGGEA